MAEATNTTNRLDLTERLRAIESSDWQIAREAAAEIERLRHDVQELTCGDAAEISTVPDAIKLLREELSNLANKVYHAGTAGYFVHWRPAYNRAMRALRITARPWSE